MSSSTIVITPPIEVVYGEVTTGQATNQLIYLQNFEPEDITILALAMTSGSEFVLTGAPTLPALLAQYDTITLVITCTPVGTGPIDDQLTITSDALNNPNAVTVSATGVAPGTVALTVSPSLLNFPNTKVGDDSAEQLFTILNTGTVDVTIATITFDTDFDIGTTNPTLPAVIHSGDTLDFGVKYVPTAPGFISQTVEVGSDASASPFEVTVTGTGYLIDPAYILPGLITDWPLYALVSTDAVITVLQITTAGVVERFNCEEAGRTVKLFNFTLLGEDKTLKWFWYHYENVEAGTQVTFTFNNQETGATQVFTRTIGSNTILADAVLKDMFEVTMEGENIKLMIDRAADQGALVFVDMGFKFLPSEEQLGTFANPTDITPAYIWDELCPPFLLFAFEDSGDPVVTSMDPEDFDCESDVSASNSVLLPFPTEQGAIPGFSYEKQVMRCFFHYEDYGEAVLDIAVGTMRGQTTHQEVSIGTSDANRCVYLAVADLEVTDEVIEISFTKISGPISIIDYTIKYAIKGEHAKPPYPITVDSLVGCEDIGSLAPCISVLQFECVPQEWTVGTPVDYTPTISGGTPPYNVVLWSGSIPDGITLDEATGGLSGTPTSFGDYTPTYRISDSGIPTQLLFDECDISVEAKFDYYSDFVVKSGQVPSPQNGYTAAIVWTDARFKSVGEGGHVDSSQGFDMRPYNPDDNSARDYELVWYDETTGSFEMHVLVSEAIDTDSVVRMKYGNPGLTTDGSSTAAWPSEYKLVQHFGSATSLSVADSTSNNNDATNNGATGVSGQVGGAVQFVAASSQFMTIADAANLRVSNTDSATWEFWIQRSGSGPNPQFYLDKRTVPVEHTGWAFYLAGGNPDLFHFYIGADNNAGDKLLAIIVAFTITTQWTHLFVTYDGAGGITVLRNAFNSPLSISGTLLSSSSSSATLFEGSDASATAYYDGKMDEFRFSKGIARSVDWGTLAYNNQANMVGFWQLLAEVAT